MQWSQPEGLPAPFRSDHQIFLGEKTAPLKGSGLRPKPLKSLYAFRGSIERAVFRGIWGNLPGDLGKLFHFSGGSGETIASGVVSIAVSVEVGSDPRSVAITAPVLVGNGSGSGGLVKKTFG